MIESSPPIGMGVPDPTNGHHDPLALIFGRRSGTSSMAKELYDLGYPLRGPMDCRPFPKSQPQGHYEPFIARDKINREILLWFRMPSAVPGLVPFLSYPPLTQWVKARPDPFIVKDPNLNHTWPVWVRSLPFRRLFGIWAARDPSECKASLVKRYHMTPDDAHWCIEMEQLTVDAAARHMPMLKVDLHDPNRTTRVKAWLHVNGISPMIVRHPEDILVTEVEEVPNEQKEKEAAPCP